MKELFPGLIGNDMIRSSVGEAILSGGTAHTFVFTGPEGSGKHTAARICSAALICTETGNGEVPLPCGRCRDCDKALRGIHPDVITYGVPEDRKTIPVDEAREIRSELYIAPNEAERKVIIIEDADLMQPEAQNALLLSFEEPPAFVTFILLATDPAKLLPTIRSRAVIIRMERLGDSIIEEELLKLPKGTKLQKNDPDAFSRAVRDSDGVLGLATKLLDRKGQSGERETAGKIVHAIVTGKEKELAELSVSMTNKRDELMRILELCESAVRDLTAVSCGVKCEPLFYTDAEGIPPELRKRAVTSKLTSLFDRLEDARSALDGNAYAPLIKENLLFGKEQ